jgi:hypothetical protein
VTAKAVANLYGQLTAAERLALLVLRANQKQLPVARI